MRLEAGEVEGEDSKCRSFGNHKRRSCMVSELLSELNLFNGTVTLPMHSILRLRAAAARPLAFRRCFSQSHANLSGHNKVYIYLRVMILSGCSN